MFSTVRDVYVFVGTFYFPKHKLFMSGRWSVFVLEYYTLIFARKAFMFFKLFLIYKKLMYMWTSSASIDF